MAEGVQDSAETPTVTLSHGHDLLGASSDGTSTDGIRILHHQEHSHRATTKRLRTEVQVGGRLVGNPELRTGHCQLRDRSPIGAVNAV